jgi:hypothetical protein
VFLDEGCRNRQHDHRGNHDGRADVAQEIGDHSQRQQQRVQRVARAIPDLLRDRRLAFSRNEVGSKLLQPRCRFLGKHSVRRRAHPGAGFARLKAADGGKPAVAHRGIDTVINLGRLRQHVHGAYLNGANDTIIIASHHLARDQAVGIAELPYRAQLRLPISC